MKTNEKDFATKAREDLKNWQQEISENVFFNDDLCHSIEFYFPEIYPTLVKELSSFGFKVANELEPLVALNNLDENLPILESYNFIGERINHIRHHPSYEAAGNIIYSSRLMERISKRGGLLEGLIFFLLSSHAGEAGHNCPIACSAGIIRCLTQIKNFPHQDFYLTKLIAPSFTDNFTGAQFLTEIQGGSDVGINETFAFQDSQGAWRVSGEKWFCSNANAELMLVTARYDLNKKGTHGLALFLIPSKLNDDQMNAYCIRRLKQKVGTRSMATGEIEFKEALAFPVGSLENGFRLVMENVLHLSRIFNCFTVLGMGRRAYQIAKAYALHRHAFGNPLLTYPLVLENLATIKAENTAMLAQIFAVTRLQDELDQNENPDLSQKLLLRLLVNLNKSFTAQMTVNHIHHCIDILGGNGTIESFSSLPRLMRDCLVCENWEGTHYTLWMQILRDIYKSQVDVLFMEFMQQQLNNISESSKCYLLFEKVLVNLEIQLRELKNSDEQLQTILIQDIVKTMTMLGCAMFLLQEAEDQIQKGEYSKMNCLLLFINLHLPSDKFCRNKEYLELVRKVLG